MRRAAGSGRRRPAAGACRALEPRTRPLWVFLGAYAVLAGITWFFSLRPSFAVERVPSVAHAAV